ncbi:MAG: cryptochrome/photolyase family protein, partial [Aureliella sp.]
MNLLIFPNQLFGSHPGLKLKPSRVVLIEDSLYFGDPRYPMKFHKQKLWLHRTTMKRYEKMLQAKGIETLYLDYDDKPDSLRAHLQLLTRTISSSAPKLVVAEPTDFLLEKRLQRFCGQLKLGCQFVPSPGF